jgi:peptide chain release factor
MTKIWLQITSGRCPAECQWVVTQLTHFIINDCQKKKIPAEIIEMIHGDEKGTNKSALLRIDNADFPPLLKLGGTVLWHGQSPFRVKHKRKNWYVGVEVLSLNDETKINSNIEKEIKVDTFKSSGKGGQNVNKRDTAVRITHLPTKLSFVGREERTQLMNRKLALARLQNKLATINQSHLDNNEKERWRQHDSLERGNPIMRFKGNDFKQY